MVRRSARERKHDLGAARSGWHARVKPKLPEPKPWIKLPLVVLLLCRAPAFAATGIDSAGYLWVMVLVLLGLIALLALTFKFLRGIRRDSLKQDDER